MEDYKFCIFDTLELDDELEIPYHLSEEDALSVLNPIPDNVIYTTIENNQNLYIRINDIENDTQYYVLITLSSIGC